MALEKATLTRASDPSQPISVLFNPEEYTVAREVNYAQAAIPGLSAPLLQFVNGAMQTLEMELLVDTLEEHRSAGSGPGSDVREQTRKIVDLMDIDPATHAPPIVLFTWGSLTFTCVLARATQRFIMFRPDGIPVRARLQVTFNEFRNVELEAKEIKRETADYSKRHTVGQGETLSAIAAAVYNDPGLWRPIAIRNGIDDPRDPPFGIDACDPASALPRSGQRRGVRVTNPRFAPELSLRIAGAAAPAELRASLTSVQLQSSLGAADRVELGIANESLRWLDHPLLKLDTELVLALGYAPDPLEQLFVGEIVAQQRGASRAAGMPGLTVSAQDRRARLQQGTKERWFAIPIPTQGNEPLPDIAVASAVTGANLLIPIFEPVGAALSVILGGVSALASIAADGSDAGDDPPAACARATSTSSAGSAAENGWELLVDHDDPLGGRKLRFFSPLDHLTPDLTLGWGRSLLEFTPRVSKVGQIPAVTASIWVARIKQRVRRHRRLGLGPGAAHARRRPVAGSPRAGPSSAVVDQAAADAAERAARARLGSCSRS